MSELFIPPGAITNIDAYSNIILGIQGQAGTGKTASSLTFPNVIVAAFEKPAIKEMIEELTWLKMPIVLPFFDETFVLKELKGIKDANTGMHNSPKAFREWLIKDALKLTQEQTLVVDSFSSLDERWDEIRWGGPEEDNKYAAWDDKITYLESISNRLIALKCNVVVLFHEQPKRDEKTGALLERVQPVVQGKFITKVKKYYPNFFRQHCVVNEKGERRFEWQTQTDKEFVAKCSRPSVPARVEARYENLVRKKTT